MKINNLFNKFIALTVSICLLVSITSADAFSAVKISDNSQVTNEDMPLVSLDNGKITSVNDTGSNLTVVNIQDLHCHKETQKKISNIIEEINKENKIKEIYVEGGYGKIDVSWLNKISDKKIKEQIIEQLLEDGEITAGEYYVSLKNNDVELKGLDERTTHQQNLERLSQIMDNQEKYATVISKVRNEIARLNKRYINYENRKFSEKIKQYKTEGGDSGKLYIKLFKYIDKINENFNKYNNITKIVKENYPNMATYILLDKENKKIKPEEIGNQIKAILTDLKAVLSYREYSDIITKTNNLKDINKLAWYINKYTTEKNIDLSKYGSLGKFLEIRKMTASLNPVKLLEEERDLIEQIRYALSYNKTEYEIAYISDFEEYFEKYLKYGLTSKDWHFAKKGFNKFRQLYAKYAVIDRIKEIEKDFVELDKYYNVNDERNSIFVNNILDEKIADKIKKPQTRTVKEIIKDSKEVIIVVAGGYHSDELSNMLSEKSVNDIVITPNITGEIEKASNKYKQTIKEQAVLQSQALAFRLASCNYHGQKKLLLKAGVEALGNDANAINKLSSVLGIKINYDENKNEIEFDNETISLNGDISDKEKVFYNKVTASIDAVIEHFDNAVKFFTLENFKVVYIGTENKYLFLIDKILSDSDGLPSIRAENVLQEGKLQELEDEFARIMCDNKNSGFEKFVQLSTETQDNLIGNTLSKEGQNISDKTKNAEAISIFNNKNYKKFPFYVSDLKNEDFFKGLSLSEHKSIFESLINNKKYIKTNLFEKLEEDFNSIYEYNEERKEISEIKIKKTVTLGELNTGKENIEKDIQEIINNLDDSIEKLEITLDENKDIIKKIFARRLASGKVINLEFDDFETYDSYDFEAELRYFFNQDENTPYPVSIIDEIEELDTKYKEQILFYLYESVKNAYAHGDHFQKKPIYIWMEKSDGKVSFYVANEIEKTEEIKNKEEFNSFIDNLFDEVISGYRNKMEFDFITENDYEENKIRDKIKEDKFIKAYYLSNDRNKRDKIKERIKLINSASNVGGLFGKGVAKEQMEAWTKEDKNINFKTEEKDGYYIASLTVPTSSLLTKDTVSQEKEEVENPIISYCNDYGIKLPDEQQKDLKAELESFANYISTKNLRIEELSLNEEFEDKDGKVITIQAFINKEFKTIDGETIKILDILIGYNNSRFRWTKKGYDLDQFEIKERFAEYKTEAFIEEYVDKFGEISNAEEKILRQALSEMFIYNKIFGVEYAVKPFNLSIDAINREMLSFAVENNIKDFAAHQLIFVKGLKIENDKQKAKLLKLIDKVSIEFVDSNLAIENDGLAIKIILKDERINEDNIFREYIKLSKNSRNIRSIMTEEDFDYMMRLLDSDDKEAFNNFNSIFEEYIGKISEVGKNSVVADENTVLFIYTGYDDIGKNIFDEEVVATVFRKLGIEVDTGIWAKNKLGVNVFGGEENPRYKKFADDKNSDAYWNLFVESLTKFIEDNEDKIKNKEIKILVYIDTHGNVDNISLFNRFPSREYNEVKFIDDVGEVVNLLPEGSTTVIDSCHSGDFALNILKAFPEIKSNMIASTSPQHDIGYFVVNGFLIKTITGDTDTYRPWFSNLLYSIDSSIEYNEKEKYTMYDNSIASPKGVLHTGFVTGPEVEKINKETSVRLHNLVNLYRNKDKNKYNGKQFNDEFEKIKQKATFDENDNNYLAKLEQQQENLPDYGNNRHYASHGIHFAELSIREDDEYATLWEEAVFGTAVTALLAVFILSNPFGWFTGIVAAGLFAAARLSFISAHRLFRNESLTPWENIKGRLLPTTILSIPYALSLLSIGLGIWVFAPVLVIVTGVAMGIHWYWNNNQEGIENFLNEINLRLTYMKMSIRDKGETNSIKSDKGNKIIEPFLNDFVSVYNYYDDKNEQNKIRNISMQGYGINLKFAETPNVKDETNIHNEYREKLKEMEEMLYDKYPDLDNLYKESKELGVSEKELKHVNYGRVMLNEKNNDYLARIINNEDLDIEVRLLAYGYFMRNGGNVEKINDLENLKTKTKDLLSKHIDENGEKIEKNDVEVRAIGVGVAFVLLSEKDTIGNQPFIKLSKGQTQNLYGDILKSNIIAGVISNSGMFFGNYDVLIESIAHEIGHKIFDLKQGRDKNLTLQELAAYTCSSMLIQILGKDIIKNVGIKDYLNKLFSNGAVREGWRFLFIEEHDAAKGLLFLLFTTIDRYMGREMSFGEFFKLLLDVRAADAQKIGYNDKRQEAQSSSLIGILNYYINYLKNEYKDDADKINKVEKAIKETDSWKVIIPEIIKGMENEDGNKNLYDFVTFMIKNDSSFFVQKSYRDDDYDSNKIRIETELGKARTPEEFNLIIYNSRLYPSRLALVADMIEAYQNTLDDEQTETIISEILKQNNIDINNFDLDKLPEQEKEKIENILMKLIVVKKELNNFDKIILSALLKNKGVSSSQIDEWLKNNVISGLGKDGGTQMKIRSLFGSERRSSLSYNERKYVIDTMKKSDDTNEKDVIDALNYEQEIVIKLKTVSTVYNKIEGKFVTSEDVYETVNRILKKISKDETINEKKLDNEIIIETLEEVISEGYKKDQNSPTTALLPENKSNLINWIENNINELSFTKVLKKSFEMAFDELSPSLSLNFIRRHFEGDKKTAERLQAATVASAVISALTIGIVLFWLNPIASLTILVRLAIFSFSVPAITVSVNMIYHTSIIYKFIKGTATGSIEGREEIKDKDFSGEEINTDIESSISNFRKKFEDYIKDNGFNENKSVGKVIISEAQNASFGKVGFGYTKDDILSLKYKGVLLYVDFKEQPTKDKIEHLKKSNRAGYRYNGKIVTFKEEPKTQSVATVAENKNKLLSWVTNNFEQLNRRAKFKEALKFAIDEFSPSLYSNFKTMHYPVDKQVAERLRIVTFAGSAIFGILGIVSVALNPVLYVAIPVIFMAVALISGTNITYHTIIIYKYINSIEELKKEYGDLINIEANGEILLPVYVTNNIEKFIQEEETSTGIHTKSGYQIYKLNRDGLIIIGTANPNDSLTEIANSIDGSNIDDRIKGMNVNKIIIDNKLKENSVEFANDGTIRISETNFNGMSSTQQRQYIKEISKAKQTEAITLADNRIFSLTNMKYSGDSINESDVDDFKAKLENGQGVKIISSKQLKGLFISKEYIANLRAKGIYVYVEFDNWSNDLPTDKELEVLKNKGIEGYVIKDKEEITKKGIKVWDDIKTMVTFGLQENVKEGIKLTIPRLTTIEKLQEYIVESETPVVIDVVELEKLFENNGDKLDSCNDFYKLFTSMFVSFKNLSRKNVVETAYNISFADIPIMNINEINEINWNEIIDNNNQISILYNSIEEDKKTEFEEIIKYRILAKNIITELDCNYTEQNREVKKLEKLLIKNIKEQNKIDFEKIKSEKNNIKEIVENTEKTLEQNKIDLWDNLTKQENAEDAIAIIAIIIDIIADENKITGNIDKDVNNMAQDYRAMLAAA